MEIQEQVNAAPTASAQKYYLDGSVLSSQFSVKLFFLYSIKRLGLKI